MGFFGKLFGKRPGWVRRGEQIVIRDEAIARSLARPTTSNWSDDPPEPCPSCGEPLAELLITTGGPLGDADLWRDVPVAVDGWACEGCGVFRFPRKMAPERINEIMSEGATHGRAGRFAEAEQCFARIVWDWPGYTAAHLNYAEATRERLHRDPPSDEPIVRALEKRMVEQYELAIAAFLDDPVPAEANPAIARACVTVATIAVDDRDLDRARAFLGKLDHLVGIPERVAAEAAHVAEMIEKRIDLFRAAANAFGDRIRLVGQPLRVATADERPRLDAALAGLAQHLALAPERWEAHWLHAKAMAVLERDDDPAWRAAMERFPRQREIAQDYSSELMIRGRFAEARTVMRAYSEHVPDDAQSYSNLATLDILSGDLEAAQRSLDRCLALDPKDKVAVVLHQRLVGYRNGMPLPKTLAELERG